MKLENQTTFPAHAVPGFGPDNAIILTLVFKGTFEIVPGGVAKPAEKIEPIAFADVVAEGARGAVPQCDSDLAPFKPRADVLLVGKAHAPRGRPVGELDVSLKLGKLDKTVRVFGERRWDGGGLARDPRASEPKPFAECDLSFAMAFGGMDEKSGGTSAANPVGLGFIAEKAKKSSVEGVPLPRLEDPSQLIESWKDRPEPSAFTSLGRGWSERTKHLGTYDDRWKAERSPRPPRDFSFAFHNAAPADQQAKGFLTGRESFEIVNASARGTLAGQLPRVEPVVTARRAEGAAEALPMNLDTVVLMPERMVMLLTWRGAIAIPALDRNDLEEIVIKLHYA